MTEIKDVLAERGARYGDFIGVAAVARNFRHLTGETLERTGRVLADDQAEALTMIYSKIGRILNGDPNHVDSWLDIAGYATLVAQRLAGGAKTEQKVFHGKTFPEPGDGWKYVRELERDGDYGHYLFERTVPL